MKRILSLMLALALLAGLGVFAWAEPEPDETEEQDEYAIDTMLPELDETIVLPVPELEGEPAAGMGQQLADITLQVKNTLGVDDDYTEFYSDFSDGLFPRWSLNWSDDSRQLSVDVSAGGVIQNVYRWEDSEKLDRFYGFDPAFPALTRTEAEEQAEAWFEKLFTGEESARVDSVRTYLGKDGYYRFAGTVLKNGLESPVTFYLSLDGRGIYSFNRSDTYSGYVGELPNAKPAAKKTDASAALKEAVELELYYVSDEDGSARLRYVPVGPYTVVDAQTGEAVDMDALYASLDSIRGENGIYAMDAAADMEVAAGADGGAFLTEVELDSIANYGDVLDQDALDEDLRGLAALGLEGFEMQRGSYSMDSESGDVTASLRYTAQMTEEQLYGYSEDNFLEAQSWGDDLTIFKYITVDAKTGKLMSVSTSYPLWLEDDLWSISWPQLAEAADAFLAQAVPDMAESAELCTLSGYNVKKNDRFYARVQDGYFFPENYISVTVNPGSGTVDNFRYTWDEDMTFASAEDIVTEDEAVDAYADALDVTLGYAAWPVDTTAEEIIPYAMYLDSYIAYVEELTLVYYYGGLDDVEGVDALTGEAVVDTEEASGAFTYDDLEDVASADEIIALGEAGIGFAGGKFEPAAELTQRDAVTLLLQAGGSGSVPKDDEALMQRAAWQGFVTPAEWGPDGVLTRMEFTKMLLGASRYGDAAELLDKGDDDGYIAIAEALGMTVRSPWENVLTREIAASLLYRFMDR